MVIFIFQGKCKASDIPFDAFFIEREEMNMKYGLIGEKLGHSFSKEIHEQLANYTYDLIPLSKEELTTFMETKNFEAINVTIPYKKTVLPYIDVLDQTAKKVHSVNTIVNRNGKLYGFNTDYDGFVYMLKKHDISIQNKNVLILGNGGASVAIQAVITDLKPKTMVVVSRSASEGSISYEECYQMHYDAQVIINTSPCGMYPNNYDAPIDLDDFPTCEAVVDIIYNPLITPLCLQAKEKQIPFVMGLEMLIAQAKYAVEHFLNTQIEDRCIDFIYNSMMQKQMNLILIGMPSAGKTTIGKQLALKLNKNFIDLDEEIVASTKQSIPDIFASVQEQGFREIETKIAKTCAKYTNTVISCGGGIIKKKENMESLKQNGLCIFLNRDLTLLESADASRPLSSSKQAVTKLYEERLPLYISYSDFIIDNNGTIEETCNAIINTKEHWVSHFMK